MLLLLVTALEAARPKLYFLFPTTKTKQNKKPAASTVQSIQRGRGGGSSRFRGKEVDSVVFFFRSDFFPFRKPPSCMPSWLDCCSLGLWLASFIKSYAYKCC
jgi:hypothetical protein